MPAAESVCVSICLSIFTCIIVPEGTQSRILSRTMNAFSRQSDVNDLVWCERVRLLSKNEFWLWHKRAVYSYATVAIFWNGLTQGFSNWGVITSQHVNALTSAPWKGGGYGAMPSPWSPGFTKVKSEVGCDYYFDSPCTLGSPAKACVGLPHSAGACCMLW